MFFGSQAVFENALFRAQYLLTPIAKQFSTSRTHIFPGEFFDSIKRTHVTSFLVLSLLLLGTRSLEIKALSTALEVAEVVEVDVLEDVAT